MFYTVMAAFIRWSLAPKHASGYTKWLPDTDNYIPRHANPEGDFPCCAS